MPQISKPPANTAPGAFTPAPAKQLPIAAQPTGDTALEQANFPPSVVTGAAFEKLATDQTGQQIVQTSYSSQEPRTAYPGVVNTPASADSLTSFALLGAGVLQFGGKVAAGITGFFALTTPMVNLWTWSRSRSESRKAVLDLADRCISIVNEPQETSVLTGDKGVDRSAELVLSRAAAAGTGLTDQRHPVIAVGKEPFAKPVIDTLAARLGVKIVQIDCRQLTGSADKMVALVKEIEADVKGVAQETKAGQRGRGGQVKAVLSLIGLESLDSHDRAAANSFMAAIKASGVISDLTVVATVASPDGAGAVERMLNNSLNVSVSDPANPESLAALLQSRLERLNLSSSEALTIAQVFGKKVYIGSAFERLLEIAGNSPEPIQHGSDRVIDGILGALHGPRGRTVPNLQAHEVSIDELLAVYESLAARAIGIPTVGFSLKAREQVNVVYRARVSDALTDEVSQPEVQRELVMAYVCRQVMNSERGRSSNLSVKHITENERCIVELERRLHDILSSQQLLADQSAEDNVTVTCRTMKVECMSAAEAIFAVIKPEDIDTQVAIMRATLKSNELVGRFFDAFCRNFERAFATINIPFASQQ